MRAGGSSNDWGRGIASGSGGYLVTGPSSTATFGATSLTSSGSNDIFVMHVTSAGVIDWAVRAGGSSHDYGNGIASDGSGGGLVTGFFKARPLLAPPASRAAATNDIFVMHVTSAGVIDWAVRAGGSYDEGRGIASDGSGGGLVTGTFYGTATFGATSLTNCGVTTSL